MTEHSTANLIGVIAGTLTTIAFVPQVIKTWRTRQAADLSLGMLIVFNAGVALWEVYGWLAGAMPVIAANAVTLVLSMSILVLKVRHSK
jgi:MtN3 and saliva related transmembrane protein